MDEKINIIVADDKEMIVCTPLIARRITKELFNNGLIAESLQFIEKCDCDDKYNHYQIKYIKKGAKMKDMDLDVKIELLEERVMILEKTISSILQLDDRKINGVTIAVDKNFIFDTLSECLEKEKELL